jgi:hypothetical protein
MSPASDFASALRSNPRRVLAGVLAVMVLETAVVLLSALQRPPTLVLSVALASDLVLLGALAVWASGGVRRWGLTPGKGLRAAALGVLVFSGVMRVLGIPGPALLLPLALAAEATLACVVLLSLLRAVRQGGDFWAEVQRRLGSVLPRTATVVLVTELRLLHAAAQSLLRRPLRTPEPSATVFPPMAASSSGWLIPFLLIVSVMELGAAHALLHAMAPGHLWAHVLSLAVHGYGLLWLVGERRLLWASAHRLEDEALVLHLGLRWSARIPYALITRALPLRSDMDRRRVRTPRRRDSASVTPLDPPNVHLCLEADVELSTLFGLRRRVRHLDLFVDRPDAFLAALEARRSETGC